MMYMEQSKEDIYQQTLDAAAKYLSYRAFSASALYQKLVQKGYPEQAASHAIAYLIAHHFLDDEKFAQSVVQSYQKRGYGILRIRQELSRRGVEREQLEQAMEEAEPNWDAMYKLLEKRLHGDVSDHKEVKKAVAALQRRGFLWEDIQKALRTYVLQADVDGV